MVSNVKVGEPLGLAAKFGKFNFFLLGELFVFFLVQPLQIFPQLIMNTLVNEFFHGKLSEEDTIDKADSIVVVGFDLSDGVEVVSEEQDN